MLFIFIFFILLKYRKSIIVCFIILNKYCIVIINYFLKIQNVTINFLQTSIYLTKKLIWPYIERQNVHETQSIQHVLFPDIISPLGPTTRATPSIPEWKHEPALSVMNQTFYVPQWVCIFYLLFCFYYTLDREQTFRQDRQCLVQARFDVVIATRLDQMVKNTVLWHEQFSVLSIIQQPVKTPMFVEKTGPGTLILKPHTPVWAKCLGWEIDNNNKTK